MTNQDSCSGCSTSGSTGVGRRMAVVAACAAALFWAAGAAFVRADDTPRPRVGEVPPGCTGNALFAEISRPQSSVCVGTTIPYRITIQNTAFPSCRKENIVVRFWNPDHNPGPDPCGAPLFPPDFQTTIPALDPGDPARVYCAAGAFCTCTVADPPGCVIDNTVAVLNYTPATPGTKIAVVCVTATSLTGIPPDTFLATPNITTVVNALPACDITGPASICAGGSAQYCAPEGANLTYLWEGTGVAGQTTRCVTVNTAGEYCVTVTNTQTGCTRRCCKSLTVNPPPDCTISGPSRICQGGSAQFCAPEGANLTYLWEGPGVAGQTTRCVTVNTASDDYCVTVTNTQTGCVQRCCKSLTVNPNPSCEVTGNNSICSGGSTQFCATPSGGTPPYSYSWSGPAGFVPPGDQNCTGSIDVAGLYSVTVTDANGCTTSCNRTLTVNPPPDCTISGPSSICQGGSAQYCAPEGVNLTYLWEGTGVAGLTTRCVTVSAQGEYCVTVTNTQTGCSKRCCKSLTVNPNPTCSVTGDNEICGDETTEFCAVPAGGTPPYSYSWSGPVGFVPPGNQNCTGSINIAGQYSVTVTDANGCTTSCNRTLTVVQCALKACSPGYWRQKQHFPAWCQAGYNPEPNRCFPGPATLFKDAFQIVNFSSPQIPASFNPATKTLLSAVQTTGGSFNQALFHGTASLLNAAAFPLDFGHTQDDVRAVMQQAFAGTITFAQAHNIFAGWIAQEAIGGCPCNRSGCTDSAAAKAGASGAADPTSDGNPSSGPKVGGSGMCGGVGAASMVPLMIVGWSVVRRRRVGRPQR